MPDTPIAYKLAHPATAAFLNIRWALTRKAWLLLLNIPVERGVD